jgi:acetyl-CoA carboxylase alpha subunit
MFNLGIGLVDELIPEPLPGAHAHPELCVAALRGALIRHLGELCAKDIDVLLGERTQRYRRAGD